MNVLEFMRSPDLTPGSFEGDTWQAWDAVLSGAFALPMDDDTRAIFDKLAGGRQPPERRVRECWVIAGRRSAKTESMAGVATYLATVGVEVDGLLDRLSPGERGVISILAVDRHQAKVALAYVRGLVEQSPILKPMLTRENRESLEFGRVTIEVATNSYRAVRGRTLIAAILDEVAFFRDTDSASPDTETYRALIPGLATTGGLLIGISSPYARRGLLFDKWQKHYGKDGDVLVIQGGTRDFNSTIPDHVIDEAVADDPDAAKAEWFGEFRSDVEAFLTREVIEDAVRQSPLEIPPQDGIRYFGFADPAGGGSDEYCISIGHTERDRVVVDCLRARRGVPASITEEYAALLKDYKVREITADRYAGSWPADEFGRHGIRVYPSKASKSDLYIAALAAFNSGRVEIPRDDRLINQLITLERRTSRSGRDTVDHGPGGHDDRANVVCGLAANNKSDPGAGLRRLCTW